MISKEEVRRIAKLARLELTDAETEKMQKNLSAVFDYFTVLKKVKNPRLTETGKIKKENRLRKDEAKEKRASLAADLISAAPDTKDGYIKVKSILQ